MRQTGKLRITTTSDTSAAGLDRHEAWQTTRPPACGAVAGCGVWGMWYLRTGRRAMSSAEWPSRYRPLSIYLLTVQ